MVPPQELPSRKKSVVPVPRGVKPGIGHSRGIDFHDRDQSHQESNRPRVGLISKIMQQPVDPQGNQDEQKPIGEEIPADDEPISNPSQRKNGIEPDQTQIECSSPHASPDKIYTAEDEPEQIR